MPAFPRGSRALLAGAGILALGAAFASAPQAASGGATPRRTPLGIEPDVPVEAPVRAELPRRDPFAGGDAGAPRATSTSVPPTIPVLPPNLGARASTTAAGPTTVRVAAVVTGRRPYALIVDGDAVRIVAIGDPLRGSAVSAIDDTGVHLADGSRLLLDHPDDTGGPP
jgi:hypothetical protein